MPVKRVLRCTRYRCRSEAIKFTLSRVDAPGTCCSLDAGLTFPGAPWSTPLAPLEHRCRSQYAGSRIRYMATRERGRRGRRLQGYRGAAIWPSSPGDRDPAAPRCRSPGQAAGGTRGAASDLTAPRHRRTRRCDPLYPAARGAGGGLRPGSLRPGPRPAEPGPAGRGWGRVPAAPAPGQRRRGVPLVSCCTVPTGP